MSGSALRRPDWLDGPACRRVLDALEAGGRPVRVVGGAVRDSLNRPGFVPHDLDLATPEPPERVAALLEAAGLSPIPTGLAHGTVSTACCGQRFEITTLRRDVATDGRHAQVAWTDDFIEDAARRDFTINAMSLDRAGHLHDPFGGQADLAAGRVRFVGDPDRRIAEDHLRILRFFRFLASHGRPPVDQAGLAACARGIAGLDRLAGERLYAELFRLLVAPRAAWAVRLMVETGALARVIGTTGEPDRLERLATGLPDSDAVVRLAALLAGADPGFAIARLRLSNAERLRLEALAAPGAALAPDPDPAARRRALARLGNAAYADRVRLHAADGPTAHHHAALADAARWRMPVFPLSGADLLAHGVAQGPALGRLLDSLRDWWIAADFAPDRSTCLAELERRLRVA